MKVMDYISINGANKGNSLFDWSHCWAFMSFSSDVDLAGGTEPIVALTVIVLHKG